MRKAEAMLFHLRWLEANPDVMKPPAPMTSMFAMAERTREQAEAACIWAIRFLNCRRCARASPRRGRAAAAHQCARTLDCEEARARGVAELDRRLTQFASDIVREQQQTRTRK